MMLLLFGAFVLAGCTSAPSGYNYGRSAASGGTGSIGVHSQKNSSVMDSMMNAAIIAPPEVLLVVLAGALLYEVGKEIDKELDDLDVTIEAPFPAMKHAAELALFDLGFDDLRVKDSNDSAKIVAHNVQGESVFVKLRATGKDSLLTRVSIYAGEDKELVQRIADTIKINLGYEPEVREIHQPHHEGNSEVEVAVGEAEAETSAMEPALETVLEPVEADKQGFIHSTTPAERAREARKRRVKPKP